MKTYDAAGEDIVGELIQSLENEAGRKVFTIKVLDKVEDEEALESIIVFEDKSVLMGKIHIQTVDGKLACRVQGNYI